MKNKYIIITVLVFGISILYAGLFEGNDHNNREGVDISGYGGLRMIPIEAGSFLMGNTNGEYDEVPVHKVKISHPFYISADLVTFGQYEEYCPGFRDSLKGVKRLTSNDEIKEVPEYEGEIKGTDPVVGATWYNAIAFCEWLNKKENRPLNDGLGLVYRLPTEAEWEYAVGIDTSGAVKLNGMLGIVEQWIQDWYGPYINEQQVNPAGYRNGTHKVTRGGSEWTRKESIRPTNRMSFLPDDRFPKLGFRVVLGKTSSSLIKKQPVPLYQQKVSQKKFKWTDYPVPADKPVFIPPIPFVKIPEGSNGPLFSKHNHFPSITWCPNGDLMATWYTCLSEDGTQLNIACSRLRQGSDQWERASLFWAAADRNDHSTAIWTDENTGRLFHFQGTGSHPRQGNQILVMRTSEDNGATWTDPRIINHVRSMWNPHVVMQTREGVLIVTSDANFGPPEWGRIILSRDGGITWQTPKGLIHGQHSGIVQLKDGSLMAVGRDNWNFEHPACPGFGLPISESKDWGETWSYRREPGLSGGVSYRQRPVLIRLKEGPILYIGFTDKIEIKNPPQGIEITDTNGKQRKVYGMFSAVSFDEGKTWTHHKLLTPGADSKEYDGGGNTGLFVADATHAEPAGYIQAIQTPDNMIHLISSKLHYRFNLAWLKTPTVAAK